MESQLFAYLDPGTGSMIWQVIIASFMGIVIVCGIMKNKLLFLFGKKPSFVEEQEDEDISTEKPEVPDERK